MTSLHDRTFQILTAASLPVVLALFTSGKVIQGSAYSLAAIIGYTLSLIAKDKTYMKTVRNGYGSSFLMRCFHTDPEKARDNNVPTPSIDLEKSAAMVRSLKEDPPFSYIENMLLGFACIVAFSTVRDAWTDSHTIQPVTANMRAALSFVFLNTLFSLVIGKKILRHRFQKVIDKKWAVRPVTAEEGLSQNPNTPAGMSFGM